MQSKKILKNLRKEINDTQNKIDTCLSIIKECDEFGYDDSRQKNKLLNNLENYKSRLNFKMKEYSAATLSEQEFIDRSLKSMKNIITGNIRYTDKGASVDTVFGRIYTNFASLYEQKGNKDWSNNLGANYFSWKMGNNNRRVYQMIYCDANGLDIDSFAKYELQIRFKDGDYSNYAADNLVRA
jgi:hypothetical protein